jgi:hypothetical protein
MSIFKCLFFQGNDLTKVAESARIAAGVEVGEILASLSKEFEVFTDILHRSRKTFTGKSAGIGK